MSKEINPRKPWIKPELTEESVKETMQVGLPPTPPQSTS